MHIASAFPELAGYSVEEMLLRLILRVYSVRELNAGAGQLYHVTEHWAGTAMLTLKHIEAGYKCAAFDKVYTVASDCLTGQGLRYWLDGLSATHEGTWPAS